MPVVFEPASNEPYIPYIPWDQRPPAPKLPRRYPTENDAKAMLEKLLLPYFGLYREVRLTETGYAPQRVDYVATLPEGLSLPFFGVECKRGFDDVKDACAVLRQAMRYRKARMSDPRSELSRFLGDRPPYVFIWPPINLVMDDLSWTERRDDPARAQREYIAARQGEARALSLFAAHFNIGHIEPSPWWNREEQAWSLGVVLMRGQEQVWTSRWFDGVENGFRHGGKHGTGADRGMRFIE